MCTGSWLRLPSCTYYIYLISVLCIIHLSHLTKSHFIQRRFTSTVNGLSQESVKYDRPGPDKDCL